MFNFSFKQIAKTNVSSFPLLIVTLGNVDHREVSGDTGVVVLVSLLMLCTPPGQQLTHFFTERTSGHIEQPEMAPVQRSKCSSQQSTCDQHYDMCIPARVSF